MNEEKKHIKVDLDFLDKSDANHSNSTGTKKTTDQPAHKSGKGQRNWKGIGIICGVSLLVMYLAIAGDSGSNTTSSSASSSNSVNVGDYTCSQYYSDQVDLLNPAETQYQISMAQNALDAKETELNQIQSEMDSMGTDESSSQYEIDQYNELVSEYNAKRLIYNRDLTSTNARVDRYNTSIDAHNSYLSAHCTKTR